MGNSAVRIMEATALFSLVNCVKENLEGAVENFHLGGLQRLEPVLKRFQRISRFFFEEDIIR